MIVVSVECGETKKEVAMISNEIEMKEASNVTVNYLHLMQRFGRLP